MSSVVEIDLEVAFELKERMSAPKEFEFPAYSLVSGCPEGLSDLMLIMPHVGNPVVCCSEPLTVSDIDRVLHHSGRLAA